MIDAKELNRLLLAQVDRICSELLPDGRQRGAEYTCASIFGGKGTSCSINTVKGLYKDFADDTKAGDLLSLFIARAGNPKQGMKDAYDFLGIKQFDDKAMEQKPLRGPKKYTQPESDWYELDGPAYTYLVKERGLPENVLNAYEVSYVPDKWFSPEYHGPAYVFLYKTPSGKNNCLAKYVAVERDEDGKKRLTAQKNGLQVLFGMQHVKEDWCIITTGELDALSYAAQGLPAVSVTNGDKNVQWIENCWDFLDRLKTIYLSFDMDESGESMVATVAARLGVAKCKKVILPYKDANKCHVEGISLHECIRTAKDITPSAFAKASDKAFDVWKVLEKGKRGDVGIPFMGWEGEDSIRFRLRPSEVTILAGREFSGKSTIGYQLFCYLMSLEKRCFIASLEEPIDEIFSVMLSQWFGHGVSVMDGNDQETAMLMFERTIGRYAFAYDDVTTTANLGKILESAEYSVKRYGAEFVMIDSLSATDVDMEDNTKTAEFIKEVVAFSKRTTAHVLLVTHCRKGNVSELSKESIPLKGDIRGSVLLPALATNIITCWRNVLRDLILSGKAESTANGKYTKEDVEKWPTSILTVAKQKVSGVIGQYDLFFNSSCSRFRRSYYEKDIPYAVPPKHD